MLCQAFHLSLESQIILLANSKRRATSKLSYHAGARDPTFAIVFLIAGVAQW